MSIRLSLVAKKPRPGFLGRFLGEPDWNALVRSAALQVAKTLEVDFLIAPPSDPRLIVLNYCEEALEVKIDEDSIVLSSRTSGAGPGYHAFLVDVVDSLKSHGLIFGEDEENVDEAEYFKSRDFTALQRQHALYLKALAKLVKRETYERGANINRLSLPIDVVAPATSESEVQTPNGPLPTESFIAIADADDAKLGEFAAEWFPWWARRLTAQGWLRTGLQHMWYPIPWHVPADAYERHSMLAARECLQRAEALDSSIALPTAELLELEMFLKPETPDTTAPLPHGIGYRRSLCERWLGGGWSVDLPGYWYEYSDGERAGFRFRDVYVIFSIYKAEQQESSEALELTHLEDEIATVIEEVEPKFRKRLTKHQWAPEGAEFGYALQASTPFRIALITFEGTDKDIEATIPEIARSLRNTGKAD